MGSTALVTGASSGIGREFSKQLAAAGIVPVLASRNGEKLESLRGKIESAYGINPEVISIDLSVPGNAGLLFDECQKRELDIDILINNAGAGMFGICTDLEPEKIERMLTLNIISLTNLSVRFAVQMIAKGKGHILNVGSLAGNQATPYFASYAASKGYVHDFSMALHRELKSGGVTVTCLVPGYVDTSFDANAGIDNPRYLSFSRQGSLPPSQVAEIGLRAMFKGKAKVTVGIANKALVFVAGLVPSRTKAAIIHSGIGRMIR